MKFKSSFTKGIDTSFSFAFWNSSVPIAEIVFSDKNLSESGLGVASVCIIIALYYIKPTFSHLNDYFEKNNEPILKNKQKTATNADNNDETVNKIIEVLDTKIRPAVARDGGDIKFKSFEDGVVKVELQGSCSGCPSSLMTLKQGVQNLLKHYVKEVNSVEAI